jgi:hypothetical protein
MPGRGKRGSARVIHSWRTAAGQIHLLYAYTKNEQAGLTDAQRKVLVAWVNEKLSDE